MLILQKIAIGQIASANYCDHCAPIAKQLGIYKLSVCFFMFKVFNNVYPFSLTTLHWLPVQYHINFKLYCITHRALSLKEPHYLNSLLINRLNSHSLRSSSFNPLTLPFFNKKSNGFRSFAHAAPFLWNHLPNTVRSASTYLTFRKSLKTYFFNQAFPT